MKNQEVKSPRTLEVLIQEFKDSVGNFATFNKNLGPEEKTVFRGWLRKMREIPIVTS
jgi:hypothetical protein